MNVVPGLRSYFRWKGKTEKASEYLLIIKTCRSHFERLARFLKKIHPYEVPEIIGCPIDKGFPSYVTWMKSVLRS